MKKEFKKPDVKAPRYRLCSKRLIDKDLLLSFHEKFPRFNNLTMEQFRQIVKVTNTKLWETTLSYRDGIELPEGLGYLFIGTCPSPKKTNVNYDKSIVLEQRVTHRNFESDNFLCKIFYTNYANKYKFKLREIWMFKGIRQYTRAVSKVYPERWKLFIQVDSFMHIKDLYKKYLKRDWINRRSSTITEGYNEFEVD